MAEEEKSLRGWNPEIKSDADLRDALDKAFDYRGDVTLILKDGSTLVGFVFNRNADVPEPFVQIYPTDKNEKMRLLYKEIAGVSFTGTDIASGNSWAAYVAKSRTTEK